MVSSFETETYLKTNELLERIRQEFHVRLDGRTIASWVARETDPLPVEFRAKRGQSHQFDWATARPWVARELDRPLGSAEQDLDRLDWHGARTVSARARARRDLIELGRLEGQYGDIRAMEQTAEDRARHAVNLLLAIPSRIAPRLAMITDELAIERLLDAEIRAVCQQIEQEAGEELGAMDEDESCSLPI